MATEVLPEPNLGDILQELANSSPGTKEDSNLSIPKTVNQGLKIKKNVKKEMTKSPQSQLQSPSTEWESKESESSSPPTSTVESLESNSPMHEGTHFNNTECNKLMEILTRTILKVQEKPEIDFSMFRMIMKNLNLSQFFMMDKVFNALDNDQDAKISPLELIQCLSILLRGSLEEHIKFGFKVYDTKRQGFLNREDVVICVVDALTPKLIPDSSWQPKSMPDENANALADLIFNKLDIDADGKINFSDFRSATVNDPTLIESLGSWLPKKSNCHNAHRVSQATVSNLSNRMDHLTKTSILAQFCVPANWRIKKLLKPIELKLQKQA